MSAVAAAAAAAATTARAGTIKGSTIFDDVDVVLCFLWCWSDFWSMQVKVGMTSKIAPEVLHTLEPDVGIKNRIWQSQ